MTNTDSDEGQLNNLFWGALESSATTNGTNVTDELTIPAYHLPMGPNWGEIFYAWFTPVIIVIGLVGNSISLVVFTSKNMRSLSASNYLAALSVSDLMTLINYVTIEWLRRGLPILPGHTTLQALERNGFCQVQVYLSYVSRFLSSWIVVLYTVERYIAICHPLRQRRIMSTSMSRRIIFGLCLITAVILVYKPLLSGSYVVNEETGTYYCTSNDLRKRTSAKLDIMYGISITLVPFVVITFLNLLIIRKLVNRNRKHRGRRVLTEESVIRLEFTLILLVISLCFITFNLPYFIVWAQTAFKITSISLDVHFAVRGIYYLNYCVNFFLYSITGTYFRHELKMLFRYKPRRKNVYVKCVRVHTRQTWLA